ncbi:hypothetical protein EJ05DRAFT_499524 [Pseudovirgaria hyperparasitica]|uniref:Uncharacterized protein n=1 Tax=Pseudovirgaria hyperparasitica TaxID=470096 RepID=A0A6A6WAW6_9PEZI|nr:uncharacterized protein EJ05DRAFT_499524 [Pseudovirgaria hyperparasitica]KAF2759100.1 hypothetical protein EJ05DRAFT_499524 [Pseudovirgaria hyperparasitica]
MKRVQVIDNEDARYAPLIEKGLVKENHSWLSPEAISHDKLSIPADVSSAYTLGMCDDEIHINVSHGMPLSIMCLERNVSYCRKEENLETLTVYAELLIGTRSCMPFDRKKSLEVSEK